MGLSGLYAIADHSWNPTASLDQLVSQYLAGGARIVQLRMKRTSSDEVLAVARGIMKLKEHHAFTFIVNDHVDVAAATGADGVHLGEGDMSIHEARSRVRGGTLVGHSSHSLDEALAAAHAGADYIAFGAIFPSPTKGHGHPIQGIEALARTVDAVDVPVVAIGGINRTNIDEVMRTGASAVAVISALCQAPSIVDETRWFVNKLCQFDAMM